MKSKLSIFLAEDDEDDALFFEDAIFELSADADLVVLNDGVELMQRLETNEVLPDIIFLDLNMPKKGGFQCLEEIKTNPSLKGIKTIILSTTTDAEQISKCYSLGADIFITKVSNQHEFKANLKRCLV
jgi:CheY-like chemotaxis protein